MSSILELQSALGRPLFMALAAVMSITAFAVLGMAVRAGAHRAVRIVAMVGLLVTVASVLSLTLRGMVPPGIAPRRLFLDPIAGAWGWDAIAWRPVVDNVVLFVPVGAFAAATFVRSRLSRVWVVTVALSVGIEGFQYLVQTGRVANSADVLANALGAAVGIALATVLGARPPRTPVATASPSRASVTPHPGTSRPRGSRRSQS